MTDAPRRTPTPSPDPRVTSAMEDYLKAAYHLEAEGGPITTQRMAEELGLSQPSVTNMVKRLDELNLVVHSPYRGITLTETGRRISLEVIRHHRLLELYLSEALGFDLEQVHAEAERLEHHVSEELEARMERALGYPEFDPHGDPIPGRDGRLPTINDTTLTEVPVGSCGVISRVSDRDPARLSYLTERGFRPGTRLTVIEHMPFEGPVRVVADKAEHLLPYSVAGLVRIEPEA
ncbi:MAG TPA: metal-dependent transcriptional regulator [Thermomicrobiales bacterium]|nr:metal-dependent transcriptional regulator [Thermomicrobiales bacterium]